MEHQHTYDAQGKRLCCTEEEKIYTKAGAEKLIENKNVHDHSDHHDHNHSDHDGHDHSNMEGGPLKMFLPSIISLLLLLVALYFDHSLKPDWFTDWIRIGWYIIAYLPVGLPVLKEAFGSILQGAFFSEFFLMGIATVGAFAIGEYPEGVAVMLFY